MMSSIVKKKQDGTPELIDFIFRWSVADILNKDLYKDKVDEIPHTFSSVDQYLHSFRLPLIEETHANLLSNITALHSSPFCEITSVKKKKESIYSAETLLYTLHLKVNGKREHNKSKYEPQFGDLIALTDCRPKYVSDLGRPRSAFNLALVKHSSGDSSSKIRVVSSKPISSESELTLIGDRLFIVCLTNLNTNIRIWDALNPCKGGNSSIFTSVLRVVSPSIEENCGVCLIKEGNMLKCREVIASFGLDDSQKAAVSSCVALTECEHQSGVKLICGPPGTGKTKTISSLVYTLLKLKCRTVTCAPTNVAILGVTKKLMSCLSGSREHEVFGLGDIVLFGNEVRMKIEYENQDLHDVFLDHRVAELARFFSPLSGWKYIVNEMISILEVPRTAYLRYLEQVEDVRGRESEISDSKNQENVWTFEEFFENKFVAIKARLVLCIKGLFTHMPTSFLRSTVKEKLSGVSNMLSTLETFLHCKQAFVRDEEERSPSEAYGFNKYKLQVLEVMKFLSENISLPEFSEHDLIEEFCLKNAYLVFCTVSSSAKLRLMKEMTPFEMVIIDEAAQVKECESSILRRETAACNGYEQEMRKGGVWKKLIREASDARTQQASARYPVQNAS